MKWPFFFTGPKVTPIKKKALLAITEHVRVKLAY